MSENSQFEDEGMFDDPEKLEEEQGESEQELIDDPNVIIDALMIERDEMKDKWLRALAEAENLRKRAAKERIDSETYGGTKLARDLLSVYDNMSRALEAIDENLKESASSLVEGIELTQRELLSVFERHKIVKISPEIGMNFDPNIHQAMFEAPVANTQAGTIIQVMAEGFQIGDRLLRAAQVGVSSGQPAG